MRPTSSSALASRQALNRNASEDLALVSCSASLDSQRLELTFQPANPKRDKGRYQPDTDSPRPARAEAMPLVPH